MEDLLAVVLYQRVEILYGTAGAKNIDLKKLVELGSLDAVLHYFRQKEVQSFGFDEIKKRMEYLESKCGFDLKEVFSFGLFKPEEADRFAHWNVEHLQELYNKRHGIVHRDERPITSLEELQEIYDGLAKIVLSLGFRPERSIVHVSIC